MKIKTAKDVEKLDLKIKNELGIDVKKYGNEEAFENFFALLVFPEYILTWTIRPIIISFFIFITGFFVLNLVHIEYVLYALIGLALFLVNGVLAGVLFLTWKMKKDMWGIIDYTLTIMKSALSDINQVNQQVTVENRKEVLGLLFKGVIHIVTIPILSQVISARLPLIGVFVIGFVKRVLGLITNRIKFEEEVMNESTEMGEESNVLQIYAKTISSVSKGLETIINFTFSIAQFPLKVVFCILFMILSGFVYLIN